MSARTRGLACGASCLCAASFYSAVQPGNTFEHYLMLLRFTDRARYGHEVFPELAGHIASFYRLVAETEGRRIYISNERLGELSKTP